MEGEGGKWIMWRDKMDHIKGEGGKRVIWNGGGGYGRVEGR